MYTHSSYIEHIWGADLGDMQLRRKFNKGFQYVLCVIAIYGNIHGMFL